MAGHITLDTIFLALVGGVLPALFWLKFWLREDQKNPEPTSMITIAFFSGMAAVAIAYPLQKIVLSWGLFGDQTAGLLFVWALIEEVAKLLMFALIAMRSIDFDEPIDAVIYLVTTALGFSALENTLFLIDPISTGHGTMAIILGNFRFIGASLLHVATSATIGVCLGLAFYKRGFIRFHAVLVGLMLAILLHTVFNFSIMKSVGGYLYAVFGGLWLFIVILLALFEKVKRVKPSPKDLSDRGADIQPLILPH